MTTLDDIYAANALLQSLWAQNRHDAALQQRLTGLYERYRAERAGVAPLERQAAPPKKQWRQRRKERDAGAPRKARKLTEEQVLEIRERWAAEGGRRGLLAQMAREYGIQKSTMADVVCGRSFRHLL